MYPPDVLNEVWQSYKTTIESLNAVGHNISKGNLEGLGKTGFAHDSKAEAIGKIDKSKKNADDYVILSLWSVFERILFQYLQNEGKRMLDNHADDFTLAVYEKFDKESEYWRVDEILNLFKTLIDSELIGNAKQIKKYRDWVAHKNPRKGQPQNVLPLTAYKILSEIVKELAAIKENQVDD